MRTAVDLLAAWLRLARSGRSRPYLLITLLVDGAFIFAFLVAVQSYLPEQHGGAAALPGYALAAYGGAKLVAQLLGGRITDRIGGERGLLAGLLLVAVGQAVMLTAAVSPNAIVPAAALYGLGAAIVWPALYALASATFGPDERAKLTSALTLTTGLALIGGLGLGLVLPARFPYFIAVLVALAALVLAVGAGRGIAVPAEAADWRAEYPAIGLARALLSALVPRRLGFSAMMLLYNSGVGALLAVFRSYGRDLLGVSFQHELLLLSPAALLAGLAIVAGGVVADRVSRPLMLGAGFTAAGIVIWLLAGTTDARTVAVLAAAAGVGYGLALPSVGATSMDLSLAAGQGTLLAWFMTMEGLGHTAGPALGGWLNDTGDTAAALRAAAVLFVAAGLAAFTLLLARGLGVPRSPEGDVMRGSTLLAQLHSDGC